MDYIKFLYYETFSGKKIIDPVVLKKKSSGLAKLGIWSPISLTHIHALIKISI